jgi:hypothetical protein
VNLKIHFHLLIRLRLDIRISARTGRQHCVVLSTGHLRFLRMFVSTVKKAGGERCVIELYIKVYKSTRRNIP